MDCVLPQIKSQVYVLHALLKNSLQSIKTEFVLAENFIFCRIHNKKIGFVAYYTDSFSHEGNC